MSQGKQLSEDQLEQAADLLALGQTVTSVAKSIACARETLSRYVNHSDEYKAIAAELIATFKAQGLPVAWRQLIKLASAGDLKAAIEILNRLEGAVPQVYREERPPATAQEIADAEVRLNDDRRSDSNGGARE